MCLSDMQPRTKSAGLIVISAVGEGCVHDFVDPMCAAGGIFTSSLRHNDGLKRYCWNLSVPRKQVDLPRYLCRHGFKIKPGRRLSTA